MSETKWTPGEWRAMNYDGHWAVRAVYKDDEGRRVTAWPASCNCGAQPNEANARLIAAAPELAEALEGLLALYLVALGNDEKFPQVAAARAALAKARGE